MIALFYCGFFILFSFLRTYDLDLSQILGSSSVSEPLNLTLENNISYYLEKSVEINNEIFVLLGDEKMTNLSLQQNSEWVLSFEKNEKIFFSKIFFTIEEKESEIIQFVFKFNHANTIIFEVFFFFFVYLIYKIRIAYFTSI